MRDEGIRKAQLEENALSSHTKLLNISPQDQPYLELEKSLEFSAHSICVCMCDI